jgi:hypothetical protein
MSEQEEEAPLVETPEVTKKELTPLQFGKYAVGWLSFSIVFNILNTIVYSALYPKLLERIVGSDKNFSTAFSIINFITTLLSAIVLPLLGSFVAGVAAGAIIGSILLPIPILGFTLGGYIGATAMGLLGGTTGVKIAEKVEKAFEEKKKVKLDVVHTEGNHAPTEEVVSFQ